MRLRIFTEPQFGATYDDLLRVARRTEECGFDAFFRSDHYLTMGGDGQPGPTDAWITLAGLARETSRIRLGTLMSAATFRLPGPLAIAVAGVDQMSGGRIEFGIGAGWFEAEHSAYGIEFPPVGERFDRYSEQLAIITGLWETPEVELFSFQGKHYQLTDSPALPKPAQRPRPPVLIGGVGRRRTPALAARYADEFNVAFKPPSQVAEMFELVRAACQSGGRAPDSMRYSIAQTVYCGRNDDEVRRRVEATGRTVDSLRDGTLVGTPARIVDLLGQSVELGASTGYLQVLDLEDLDHLDLIAAEVLPQFG